MPNRVPKRARYLAASGVAATLYGCSMTLGLSEAVVATFAWLPDWFDHTEIGIIWIISGLFAVVTGLIRLKFRSDRTQKVEALAFTLLILPVLPSLVLAIIGAAYSNYLFPSVIATVSQFLFPTMIVSGWIDPRRARTPEELDGNGDYYSAE